MSKMDSGLENKFTVVALSVAVLLFSVFFTSKIWMYDDEEILQTPFGTPVSGLNQTILILKKWEYNPNKELMEVSLELQHTGTDIVKPTFTFTSKERESEIEYPVQVVYKDDTNMVVQIENVPETYRVIGLFVNEHRDVKIVESELREQYDAEEGSVDQDGEVVKMETTKPTEKVLMGDYRKIKMNNNLVTKGAIDYQIENVEHEIKLVKEQIESISNEKMPLQDELITSLEEDIQLLESDTEYLTEEENEEAISEIESKKDTIKSAEETKEELKEDAQKLLEKHEKLKLKLEDIRTNDDKDDKEDKDIEEKGDPKDEESEQIDEDVKEKKEDKSNKKKQKSTKDKDKKNKKESSTKA